MPNVLVDIPLDMITEIDLIVTQRKHESRAAGPYKPTAAEKHKAWEIAEKQGVASANAYLKSLSPAKLRSPSRVSVVLELLQLALCAPQSQQAIKAASAPAPVPASQRRPEPASVQKTRRETTAKK